MGVALTITPALSMLLLARKPNANKSPGLSEVLRRAYDRLLRAVLRYPRSVLVATALLLGTTAATWTTLEQTFLPHFAENDFLMHWVGKPGTSLAGMTRTADRVRKELLDIEGVRNFGARIGRAEVADEHVAREESVRVMLGASGLSIVFIALVLLADFRSVRLAGIVMLSLPLSSAGAVAAVAATGGVVSLGTIVGFVTVIGITARNGVLLISHLRHLQEQEGEAFGVELVVRAARERLAPIVMTAASTGLALLPLVVVGPRAGHEIEYPMAIVILGGLVSSTILNLWVTPALALFALKSRRLPE